MHKYKVNIVTLTDAHNFCDAVKDLDFPVDLIDGKGYRVSARSIMGAIAALEWNELYCVSEEEISSHIIDFIC